jgi:hypothetical protein
MPPKKAVRQVKPEGNERLAHIASVGTKTPTKLTPKEVQEACAALLERVRKEKV